MKPFPVFEKLAIQIDRAAGCFVYNQSGQAYLDMYGGHAVIVVGHTPPHIIDSTLRLLPPLCFTKEHAQIFLRSLKKLLLKNDHYSQNHSYHMQ